MFATSCFNRTFMELKLSLTSCSERIDAGFNRTFMELKLIEKMTADGVEKVLIVPLWN